MSERNFICNTEAFFYNKGYICLDVEMPEIPDVVTVEDVMLIRKSRLHVSLIAIKDILDNYPEYDDLEMNIQKLFCSFIQGNILEVTRFHEFRFCERDDGRKTLIIRCDISGLHQFVDMLNHTLDLQVEYQPTHITLYTLGLDEGIGLNTEEIMDDLSYSVEDIPETLINAFNTM